MSGIVLTLFFSSDLLSQAEKGGDLLRESWEDRELGYEEFTFGREPISFLEKDFKTFPHHGDELGESVCNRVSKNPTFSDIWLSPLGPEGGEPTALVMHPSDEQIIYASFYRGGDPVPIYKTTDGGANWEEISSINEFQVNCLAIDPNNPDTIYAGTHGYVYKSTDGGINWSSSQIKSLYLYIERLMVNKNNSNIICGGGEYHNSGNYYQQVFFKTTNGGANWDTTEFDCSSTGSYYFLDLTMDNSCDTLFFSYYHYNYPNPTYPHLYKSTNGGDTWLPSNYASSISSCYCIYSIAFDPNNSQTVYAATGKGLYRSTSGGTSWISAGLSGIATYKVIVDPQDVNRLWCGTYYQICRSTNGGSSWNYIGAQDSVGIYGTNFEHVLIGHSSSSLVYTGNRSGIFKSTNQGASWDTTNNGIYSAKIEHLASNPDALYIWVSGDACYRTTDGGVTFERRGCPSGCTDANDFVVNPRNPLVLWTAGG